MDKSALTFLKLADTLIDLSSTVGKGGISEITDKDLLQQFIIQFDETRKKINECLSIIQVLAIERYYQLDETEVKDEIGLSEGDSPLGSDY